MSCDSALQISFIRLSGLSANVRMSPPRCHPDLALMMKVLANLTSICHKDPESFCWISLFKNIVSLCQNRKAAESFEPAAFRQSLPRQKYHQKIYLEFYDWTVFTMHQTAGPVKRVQLQLSGSNLQPTTQSHSKTQGDDKQGTRQIPQGPKSLNGKSSDLRGRQFNPRHQETWSWWQVQFPSGTWRGTLLETSDGGTPTLMLLQFHLLKIIK